jgi:hypothetical protein
LLAPELRARVQQIQIRTHRLVNTSLSGGYRSTFRGSGLEFSEVRAYQPGDDVRPHRLERDRAHGRSVHQDVRRESAS